jgi:hypothetical protein
MHHLALADSQGTCKLHYDLENWGHTTVTPLCPYGETVDGDTLSHFLEKNRIDRCHFMKLNCEGAEFPILLSSPPNMLQRFDMILVLYHCDLWRSNTEADLRSHLHSSGFNTILRNQDKTRGWIIAKNKGLQ